MKMKGIEGENYAEQIINVLLKIEKRLESIQKSIKKVSDIADTFK